MGAVRWTRSVPGDAMKTLQVLVACTGGEAKTCPRGTRPLRKKRRCIWNGPSTPAIPSHLPTRNTLIFPSHCSVSSSSHDQSFLSPVSFPYGPTKVTRLSFQGFPFEPNAIRMQFERGHSNRCTPDILRLPIFHQHCTKRTVAGVDGCTSASKRFALHRVT